MMKMMMDYPVPFKMNSPVADHLRAYNIDAEYT
jgi:hypothetical protein